MGRSLGADVSRSTTKQIRGDETVRPQIRGQITGMMG